MKKIHNQKFSPVGRAAIFLLTLLPASLPLWGQSAGPMLKSDAPVITVGSNKIGKTQIDNLVNLMLSQSRESEAPSSERMAQLRKVVATNLIGQELLQQEANRLKITAANSEVDSLQKLLRENYPDEKTFQTALKEAGDTEKSLREKLIRQIRADKLMNSHVPGLEPPTEASMKAFFSKNKADFPVNDSLRASQILFRLPAGTTPEVAARKKADLQKIREELAKDSADIFVLMQRFTMAAAQYSEGPEKERGGDLHRFAPKDFLPEFNAAVSKLKVGRMSEIFKTGLGWHLVLLTEKNDGQFESYRLQTSHIMRTREMQKNNAALRTFLKSLAAKYPVKYLDDAYRDTSPTGVY